MTGPFDLMRAVRELAKPAEHFTGTDKLVLYALAMRADKQGVCWPSFRRLAEDTWLALRTVKASVGRLSEAGLLDVRGRVRDGTSESDSNEYTIRVEVVQQVHHVVPLLHQGSAAPAPGVVQQVHPGGAAGAPKVLTEVPTRSTREVSPLNDGTSTTEKRRENDDGCFGLSVAAWAEGIRSVTGRPCTRPMGRAGGALVDALQTHRTPGVDAVDDARQLGAAYAQAKEGSTLSPFGFSDWLNSGRPAKGPKPGDRKPWELDLSKSPAHRPFAPLVRPPRIPPTNTTPESIQ